MHSLRSKITVMTVCVTITAVVIVTVLSVYFIIKSERKEAEQTLLLLCETGERNLDYYFDSVEKSIKKVSAFTEKDLEDSKSEDLKGHIKRVRDYFDVIANKTNGVLTYYYRIDPEFSKDVKGFWYTNLDGEDFVKHKVTDISEYDTKDTSKLVWFTVPKSTGEPIWLPPYITDNLDKRVISYNIPVYQRGKFAGVVGIEIDYATMAGQVESIKLYDTGYAFLIDDKGKLLFHPQIDVTKMDDKTRPAAPEGLLSDSSFLKYKYNGTTKRAVWLPLSNGMRVVVTAPEDEIDGDWDRLIRQILMASLIVLVILGFVTRKFSDGITKPLRKLTLAAEQVDQDNYDFELDYEKDDELGRLTKAFKKLTAHVKEHITELNKKVFVDALTSVRNKGACYDYMDDMQLQIDNDPVSMEYAVCVFDCDNLKLINDSYGHDKGDIYLKNASRLICSTFQHSPVFRVGGDEFMVILRGEDYRNREELTEKFEKDRVAINEAEDNIWGQVHITMGLAEYDPVEDRAVIDTMRRADKEMYTKKRSKKISRLPDNTMR